MTIPGRNHNYILDIPFYTLCTQDGDFLSNPASILNNQWTLHGQIVNPETQEFLIFDTPVNVATTDTWACAWVVYARDDLTTLYTLLAPVRQRKNTKRIPLLPYTGIMTRNFDGWIICKDSRPVRDMSLETQTQESPQQDDLFLSDTVF